MIKFASKSLQNFLIDSYSIRGSIKLKRDFLQFLGRNTTKWSVFWFSGEISYKSLFMLDNLQYIWQELRGKGRGPWQTTSM